MKKSNLGLTKSETVWVLSRGDDYMVSSSAVNIEVEDFSTALSAAIEVARAENNKAVVIDSSRSVVEDDVLIDENNAVMIATISPRDDCVVASSQGSAIRDEFSDALTEALDAEGNGGDPVVILPQSLPAAARAMINRST